MSPSLVLALVVVAAVVGFVLIALSASGRMQRTPNGEAALPKIAEDVDALLRKEQVSFSRVDSLWIYGYPKIKITFETEVDALSSALQVLQDAETLIAERIRADESFGANRSTFDAKQALLLYCRENGKEAYVLREK